MIYKKGHKTNRTVMMENAVHNHFSKKYGIDLRAEQSLPNGKIPDFSGTFFDGKDTPVETIVVEIKQDAPDFFSGCGLNFEADCNYLAVPTELVGFAIAFLREEFPLDAYKVGILEVTNTAEVREVLYPRRSMNGCWRIRRSRILAGLSGECRHLLDMEVS
ncbi:MAG: hypothetical protein Q4D99_07980 [Bacillota bacterium]|nr:hypothetical protein [Bacillota bacterium]